MSPKQVIEFFGSPLKAAVALGLKAPSIYDWIDGGEVPEARQYQIEMATDGALRADKPALRVPCKEAA
jgi:hypothetical protein